MSVPRRVVPLVLLAAGCAAPDAQQLQGATGAVPGARWESALSAEVLGWSSRDLAEVRKTVESSGSAAFMIVTRGKVVAAWGDTSKTFLTHSIRKSFLSALLGIAVAGGKLDTGATLAALGIDEKKTPLTAAERQARVADLMRARSGIYLAAAGEVESMRIDRPARGSHPAGTHWVLQQLGLQRPGHDLPALDRRGHLPGDQYSHRRTDRHAGLSGHRGRVLLRGTIGASRVHLPDFGARPGALPAFSTSTAVDGASAS